MITFKHFVCAGIVVAAASTGSAAFVDDEFDGALLGPQWTWSPGINPPAEPTTSTYSLGGGYLTMTPAKGADQFINGDGAAYVQQDTPADPQWSVETKVSNFNPVGEGFGHPWTKAGLMLWENNNSWIGIFISSDGNGTQINWYGQSELAPSGGGSGLAPNLDEFNSGNIGFFADYYLRLSKTVDGYYGELSYGDGNWIPVTPLLRNPHSADGSINGKIRLFMASGAPSPTRNTAPAQFDYIRKLTLSSTPPPFAPDEFDGPSTALWRYQLGNPRGAAYTESSALAIDVFATSIGGGSDITQGTPAKGESGTIAYQNAPTTPNFSVYTQVTPTVFQDASGWRGHGIRVWQNQNTWAGIKLTKSGNAPNSVASRNIIQSMFISDNNSTRSVDAGALDFTSATPQEAGPEYLRVDKAGSQFRVQYSFDGTNWIVGLHDDYPGGWFPLTLQPNQPLLVQLFALAPWGLDNGNPAPSRFQFLREIVTSPVSDWQLY